MINHANLPAVSRATLPETYQAAQIALAECQRLDECKDWSDQAMAMASYAKQSKDDDLLKMATRIKARAIRRCGELLKLVEPAANHHGNSTRSGDAPTRKQAMSDAGLSLDQGKRAINVANIDEDEFNEAVESDTPPPITELAKRGRAALTSKKPAGFKEATHAIGLFRRFHRDMAEHNPSVFMGGMREHEIQTMKERGIEIIDWVNEILNELEEK